MNSSTSASEAGAAWGRVLRRYAVLCVVTALAIGAALVSLDPYDTGRFDLFGSRGVANFGPRFTAAGLARQPQAEAALLGSSTLELVDPARLAALSDLRFVSLAIHGTGPVEELAVAHWLLRHHDGRRGSQLKALIIGIDGNWCRSDGRLAAINPFPFWLYADSRLDYLTNLVNLKAFEAASRRIKLLLGVEAPFRTDGYRDYEEGRVWTAEAAARYFAEDTTSVADSTGKFLAAARLRDFLPEIPLQTMLVLVFLPRHHSALPPPGSAVARHQERCKAAYRAIAADRPRTAMIDLLTDGPIARKDENFWDRIHYRAPVARVIEDKIAEALRAIGGE
jgi:hypothetical protein